MKVVAKPIEMIALLSEEGVPQPLRFRMDDSGKGIDVEQVAETHLGKLAGNNMYVFTCQSEICGKLKKYEFKFELSTCKWMLFKV